MKIPSYDKAGDRSIEDPDIKRQDTKCPSIAGSVRYRGRALRHLAFGVSSTPRAAHQPAPIAIESASGAELTDIDGNRYIDFALGYGPLILGHSPADVIAAVTAEMAKGLRTASTHRGEAELAELITETVPSAEMTAFVSTGTEAVQLALRIARALTGRTRIIKFRANYHGWFDSVHIANNPGNDGAATLGQDPHAADAMLVLDWGDADALEQVLTPDFAAVLMEPAAINAGCFSPPPGYLERVREITRRLGVPLIFDEVITGYRLALGGAQEKYGVLPDLTILGKALGAGFPISSVSGTREAMQPIASGALLHRGTFNGNPVSIAAARACLRHLRGSSVEIYPRMEAFAVELQDHINAEAARTNSPICANRVGATVQIFAGVQRLDSIQDFGRADKARILDFTGDLLDLGIHTLPRGLMYFSTAHTAGHIEATRQAISIAIERRAAQTT